MLLGKNRDGGFSNPMMHRSVAAGIADAVSHTASYTTSRTRHCTTDRFGIGIETTFHGTDWQSRAAHKERRRFIVCNWRRMHWWHSGTGHSGTGHSGTGHSGTRHSGTGNDHSQMSVAI